jgi:hypothetical protein
MNSSTELERLVWCLRGEQPKLQITFREESSRDVRYTLVVSTSDRALLQKLAALLGCPAENLPRTSDTSFEVSDSWNGRGEVDMRELADELMKTEGEFFDFDITIRELRTRVIDEAPSQA